MCFDLERLILQALGGCVTVQDVVQDFRYFDSRDVLGFVDGTENPTGSAIGQSALIQSDDAPFEGGSYVVVQKYLHRLDRWQALDTGSQEAIIGRSKLENVELEDGPGQESHKTLTTIVMSRVWNTISCATTCRSAGPATPNMALISSVTPGISA
jgi:porphyrinogen peroxidase